MNPELRQDELKGINENIRHWERLIFDYAKTLMTLVALALGAAGAVIVWPLISRIAQRIAITLFLSVAAVFSWCAIVVIRSTQKRLETFYERRDKLEKEPETPHIRESTSAAPSQELASGAQPIEATTSHATILEMAIEFIGGPGTIPNTLIMPFMAAIAISLSVLLAIWLRQARPALNGAKLQGADLRNVRGLSQQDLEGACGDASTKLPGGLEISHCPTPSAKSTPGIQDRGEPSASRAETASVRAQAAAQEAKAASAEARDAAQEAEAASAQARDAAQRVEKKLMQFGSSGPTQVLTFSILFTSRNGANGLAAALVELGRLKQQPQFSPYLSMPTSRVQETAHCKDNSPRDRSGRLFFLARCADIWPKVGEAPEPVAIINAYSNRVAKDGIAALPAVKTSAFDFQLRLQASQISGWGSPKFQPSADGILEATPQLTTALCNPRVTYTSNCYVQVVDRLGVHQPDVFYTQKGYRLELLKPISLSLATQLSQRLRPTIEKGLSPHGVGKAPLAAFSISYLPSKLTGLRDVPGHSSGQQIHQSGPNQGSATNPSSDLLSVWQTINEADPSQLEIGSVEPSLFLFDQLKPAPLAPTEPVSQFDTWYEGLKNAWGHLLESSCIQSKDERDWHSDRAASVLFPRSVRTILSSSLAPTAALRDLTGPHWPGFILDMEYLPGTLPLNDAPRGWADPLAIHSLEDRPRIAVAVFSTPYSGYRDTRVEAILNSVLNIPSNLLVVSAPEKDQAITIDHYDADYLSEFLPTKNHLQNDCANLHTWPACLGKHPRVLVVAPALTSQGSTHGQPRLFAREKYVLGASIVKVAAPGNAVPVLSQCMVPSVSSGPANLPSRATAWQVTEDEGSSYSAPMVALVLAKLIEMGLPTIKLLPEAAIWRVLATADAIAPEQENEPPNGLVAFGQVNVGRALLGANDQVHAVIYPTEPPGKGVSTPRLSLVMPYLWNDAPENIEKGLANWPSGVLPYTENRITHGIDFRRILRIVRRRESQNNSSLFDIYYLVRSDDGSTHAVDVKPAVQLGAVDPTSVPSRGYCDVGGHPHAATSTAPTGQPRPACLYELTDGKNGRGTFSPIDLNRVDEIVLPPLQISATGFVNDIHPTKIKEVTAATSPWRDAFCSTGARTAVVSQLDTQNPADIDALCRH